MALTALLILSMPVLAEAEKVYAFGDSLLDDGTIFRATGGRSDTGSGALYSGQNFSNGVTAFDYLGRLTGRTVDPSNDHAIAGVFSGLNSSAIGDYPGTLAQVDAAIEAGARFAAGDLIILDGGTNEVATLADPSYGLPNGLTAPVTAGQLVTYVGSNFASILSSLRAAGARDVFLYNVPGTSAAATAVNAELVTTAAAASGHGLNVHAFDLLKLYDRVSAHPELYGFVSGDSCSASAACVANPAALENAYFTVDGLHPTTAGHALIARYLASQYNAPQAVLPETTLAQATAIMFSQILIERLDDVTQSSGVRGTGIPPAVAANLPEHLLPSALGPVTVFVSASVSGGTLAAPRTTSGPSFSALGYDIAGFTLGHEIQPTAALRFGTAFSYLDTTTSTAAFAPDRIALHAVQGSVYGSYNGPHVFVDDVVTCGLDSFETARAGVVSRLHGTPTGDTVSTETKAGYLVDWGPVRIGPVADLAYTHAAIAPYSEWGDPLLTLNVKRQGLDALTGGAGVQVRAAAAGLPWLAAILDLTAEHAFFGDGRSLVAAQTYAPTVLIRTTTEERADDLYARLRGSLHADLPGGYSAALSAFSTIERASGDRYGVDARLSYRF